MRYKKKSHHIKTLVLEPLMFSKSGNGLKRRELNDLRPSEKIVSDKEVRLGYNSRTKKFTMHIPRIKECKEEVVRSDICALDPGIRTFQTLYSPAGLTYQFGDENDVIKKNVNRIEAVREFKDSK